MEPSKQLRLSDGRPEAVIFCEDPVAPRLHRAVAAGLDWSMVLLAYGLFLVVFSLCGGEFVLDKTSLLLIGAVLPLLACLYRLTWATAGKETPGMRWAKLRLTTFDGFPPKRNQRLMRFAGSCLSLSTVVGLLWSFADEENLAWPDHISGTFPTPSGPVSTCHTSTTKVLIVQRLCRAPVLERLMRACVPEYLLGDLLEQYNSNLLHVGPISARVILFKECTLWLTGDLWRGICRLIGIDVITRWFRNG